MPGATRELWGALAATRELDGAGGGSGGAGGVTGCSPCHMAVRQAECLSSSATCTLQTSTTTDTDGTVTKIQNACFADGSKSLEVDTYPPGAPPTVTRTIQTLRNGVPCGTFHQTAIKGADASGNSVETDTEIIDDGAGNLLATDVTVTTRFIVGGSSSTQTITCAGQSPEPFVPSCLYGDLVSCADGSCM